MTQHIDGNQFAAWTTAVCHTEQLTGWASTGTPIGSGLAATAFYLLTGAAPSRMPTRSPPPPVQNSAIGALICAIQQRLSSAFAQNPAERFGSCREFAEALTERAAASLGDRSPEAVLTLDYPGDATPTAKDALGEADRRRAKSRPRSRILHSATATLARRSARRRDRLSSWTTRPAIAAAGSSAPVRTRRQHVDLARLSVRGWADTVHRSTRRRHYDRPEERHDLQPGEQPRNRYHHRGRRPNDERLTSTSCRPRRRLPPGARSFTTDIRRHARPTTTQCDHVVGISIIVHAYWMPCQWRPARRRQPPDGEQYSWWPFRRLGPPRRCLAITTGNAAVPVRRTERNSGRGDHDGGDAIAASRVTAHCGA